jgi:hypothetical protein
LKDFLNTFSTTRDFIMALKLHIILSLLTLTAAHSHGDASHDNGYEVPIDEMTGLKDWASWHMHSEHHIQGFDSSTFFALHDFESTGVWTKEDVRRIYGLHDKSTDNIPDEQKESAVSQVMNTFDTNGDGMISKDEFRTEWEDKGKRLPDLGMGPGHHGDDEYEYEIHHWEKYHSGDDVKEEDLIHPEDIEHFKFHEEEDRILEEWEKERGPEGTVLEKNIPEKFLRTEF